MNGRCRCLPGALCTLLAMLVGGCDQPDNPIGAEGSIPAVPLSTADAKAAQALEFVGRMWFPPDTDLDTALAALTDWTGATVRMDSTIAENGFGGRTVELQAGELSAARALALLCLQLDLDYRFENGQVVVGAPISNSERLAWAQPSAMHATAQTAADPNSAANRKAAGKLSSVSRMQFPAMPAREIFRYLADATGICIACGSAQVCERIDEIEIEFPGAEYSYVVFLKELCQRAGLRYELHDGVLLLYLVTAEAPVEQGNADEAETAEQPLTTEALAAETLRIQTELKKQISCVFAESTTKEAYRYLASAIGAKIEFDAVAMRRMRQAPIVNLRLTNVEVGAALHMLGQPLDLTFSVQSGKVMVGDRKAQLEPEAKNATEDAAGNAR